MTLQKYIDYKSGMSALAFNSMNNRIIPKGIYYGGSLSPGPGLSVRVEPFSAKSYDGLALHDDDWTTVNFTSVGTWFVVLDVRFDGLSPATSTWRALTPSEFQTDPNRQYFICFGSVIIPIGATVVTTDMISNTYADTIRLDPVYRGHIFNGSDTFNQLTGREIVHGLGHLDYYVHITPSESPLGVVIGDIFVVKESDKFTVYNSGTAVTQFDWILSPERSFYPQALTGARTGKILLNGTSGVKIGHFLGSANYSVAVMPVGDNPSAIGNLWVEKTNDDFTIKQDGTTGQQAVWMMFPTTVAGLFERGSASFSSTTGTVVMHSVAIGSTDYFVHIIPTQDPTPSSIGDIHVVKANDRFTVYNQGAAVSTFEYVLFRMPDNFMWRQAANFGSTTGVDINHMMNTLEYVPLITPVQYVDPIDVISFNRNFNQFSLFNQGIATSQFDWLLVSIYSWM